MVKIIYMIFYQSSLYTVLIYIIHTMLTTVVKCNRYRQCCGSALFGWIRIRIRIVTEITDLDPGSLKGCQNKGDKKLCFFL